MLDYKLIVTVRQFRWFYAQEECAVARLAINLNHRKFLISILSFVDITNCFDAVSPDIEQELRNWAQGNPRRSYSDQHCYIFIKLNVTQVKTEMQKYVLYTFPKVVNWHYEHLKFHIRLSNRQKQIDMHFNVFSPLRFSLTSLCFCAVYTWLSGCCYWNKRECGLNQPIVDSFVGRVAKNNS